MRIFNRESLMNILKSTFDKLKNLVIHPVTLMVILVALVSIVIFLLHISEDSRTLDEIILTFVGVVSFLSFLFIVFRTEWGRWTALGTGLMGHFLAVSIVYLVSAYNEPFLGYEYVLLFARAALITSGTFVVMGMIHEWWLDLNCGWRCILDRIRHPKRSIKEWRNKPR